MSIHSSPRRRLLGAQRKFPTRKSPCAEVLTQSIGRPPRDWEFLPEAVRCGEPGGLGAALSPKAQRTRFLSRQGVTVSRPFKSEFPLNWQLGLMLCEPKHVRVVAGRGAFGLQRLTVQSEMGQPSWGGWRGWI